MGTGRPSKSSSLRMAAAAAATPEAVVVVLDAALAPPPLSPPLPPSDLCSRPNCAIMSSGGGTYRCPRMRRSIAVNSRHDSHSRNSNHRMLKRTPPPLPRRADFCFCDQRDEDGCRGSELPLPSDADAAAAAAVDDENPGDVGNGAEIAAAADEDKR